MTVRRGPIPTQSTINLLTFQGVCLALLKGIPDLGRGLASEALAEKPDD